ncbi:MAG: undecaprenyl-phosphate glucose phosphotransferase [Thioalkalispiraceae bacterium]|jgi:Undecaprenyl-phosphate glucose phosphotransferase
MLQSDKIFEKFAEPSSQRVVCCNAAHLATDLMPVFDIICIFSAAFLSVYLFDYWQTLRGLPLYAGSNLTQAAMIAGISSPFFLYNKHFGTIAGRGNKSKLLRSHFIRFMFFTGFVLVLNGFSPVVEKFPVMVLLIWVIAGLVLTSFFRLLAGYIVRRVQQQRKSTEVIAIVGAGRVADRLVQALHREHGENIELLGVFDDKVINAPPSAIKSAGTIKQLLELGKTRKIDWILLTLPATAEARVLEIVERLKELSVPVGLCPQNVGLNVPYSNIDYVSDTIPVSLLADRPIKRWNAIIKTTEDLVIGGLITLCLLPVMAIVALAIKLDSRGPVFYKQKRHALNNQEFDIFKFRTMRWNPNPDNETLVQTSRDDDRITRVGRFLRASSLDELPQLFNVLKGDMSLVGPRPHAVNMRTEERLGHELTATYAHRHRVKPGMTGWSQVNGARGATDISAQLYRRVRLDLEYIENWSVLLDLKILFMTFGVVVKMTNAF